MQFENINSREEADIEEVPVFSDSYRVGTVDVMSRYIHINKDCSPSRILSVVKYDSIPET